MEYFQSQGNFWKSISMETKHHILDCLWDLGKFKEMEVEKEE